VKNDFRFVLFRWTFEAPYTLISVVDSSLTFQLQLHHCRSEVKHTVILSLSLSLSVSLSVFFSLCLQFFLFFNVVLGVHGCGIYKNIILDFNPSIILSCFSLSPHLFVFKAESRISQDHIFVFSK
jgi:hypothetical protein